MSDRKPLSTGRYWSHKYSVCWEGDRYVTQEFDAGQSIASISVLYEDEDRVRLGDCLSFCSTPLGGHAMLSASDILAFSDKMLQVINKLHRNEVAQGSVTHMLSQSVWMECDICIVSDDTHDYTLCSSQSLHKSLRVSARGTWMQGREILAQILTSLSTVLRIAHHRLSWSTIFVEEDESTTQIRFRPLEAAHIEACWPKLFSGKVIAKATARSRSQPVRPSNDYLELELDFDALVNLTSAEFPIEIGGGICLTGTYTLLIPVQERITSDKVERVLVWHLLAVTDHDRKPSKSRRKLWIHWSQWVREHQDQWLKLKDPGQVRGFKRHILGWVSNAAITLGTKLQDRPLRRSNAPISHTEPAESTFNMGITLGYAGSGLTAGRSTKLGRTEVARYHDREKHLLDWLGESMEEQLLLYDSSKQKAWLVPKIYVVHHLLLERLLYMRSQQPAVTTDIAMLYLPVQEPNPGFVYEFLKSHLGMNFPHWPGPLYCLGDAIRSILLVLDCFERSNVLETSYRGFRGFEAYDAIHQAPYFRVKKANVSKHFLALKSLGGWVNLLDDITIILFYKGIKDPIIPWSSGSSSQEKTAACLPPHQNYLAATVASLCELAKPYSKCELDCRQLAKKGFWHYADAWSQDLACHKSNCIKQRLQAIWTRPDTENEPPQEALKKNMNGAVIFRSGTGITDNLNAIIA